MSSNQLDFNFYVSGLEQSILGLLRDGNDELNQTGMKDYVKDFATYSGELDDRDTLINALKALHARFPLVLSAYGSGSDQRKAATGLARDDAIEFEHRCGFVVIVASTDLRGEKSRKGTAYRMVADVRQLLGGVQFEVELEGVTQLLNHSPFEYAGVETIGRLKDLTAFAVHFATAFHEWTPNRRTVMFYPADEIILDIEPRVPSYDEEGNDEGEENTNESAPLAVINTPGVTGAIK